MNLQSLCRFTMSFFNTRMLPDEKNVLGVTETTTWVRTGFKESITSKKYTGKKLQNDVMPHIRESLSSTV